MLFFKCFSLLAIFTIYDWLQFFRPLFASSLLSILHTLLDQERQDEMLIVGCHTLFEFVNNQVGLVSDYIFHGCQLLDFGLKYNLWFCLHTLFVFELAGFSLLKIVADFIWLILQRDGSYVFNLEGFIPKVCQLAQEVGEDERARNLRSAGLQALSSMVFCLNFHWFNSKLLF